MNFKSLYKYILSKFKRKSWVESGELASIVIWISKEINTLNDSIKSESKIRMMTDVDVADLSKRINEVNIKNRTSKATLAKHMNAINDLRDELKDLREYMKEFEKDRDEVAGELYRIEKKLDAVNGVNAKNHDDIKQIKLEWLNITDVSKRIAALNDMHDKMIKIADKNIKACDRHFEECSSRYSKSMDGIASASKVAVIEMNAIKQNTLREMANVSRRSFD